MPVPTMDGERIKKKSNVRQPKPETIPSRRRQKGEFLKRTVLKNGCRQDVRFFHPPVDSPPPRIIGQVLAKVPGIRCELIGNRVVTDLIEVHLLWDMRE